MFKLNGAKKFAVAGVAALTVAGAALAFANTLTVNSNTLGSGSDTVDTPGCSPTTSYVTAWDGTAQEFEISTITVTATGCAGKNVQVAIVNGATTLWSSSAAVVLDEDGTHTFTVADGVDAADANKIFATVNG